MVGVKRTGHSFCHRPWLDAPHVGRFGKAHPYLHSRDPEKHRQNFLFSLNSDKYCFLWHLSEFFLLHLGHLNVIDSYIINLPRRSSALPRSLKKVSVGLSGLATFNAMDLPGLLLQVGLALGCHNSARLPGQVVKGIQRCIYFFLRLQRCRLREEHSEITVQALPKTVFYHH